MSRTTAAGVTAAPDRVRFLALAREAVRARLAGTPPPDIAAGWPVAERVQGVFVTVWGPRPERALRGCVGRVLADRPLGQLVREMAVAAAADDPRFAPVSAAELDDLVFEVSLLTEPRPARAEDVVAGRDGVIVRRGGAQGVLLPKVALEAGWDAEGLLAGACRKAGLPPDAWREPDTEIRTFQAEAFAEDDP